MLINIADVFEKERESFKNLVLLHLSMTLVRIHKLGLLSYWETYIFHLSLSLSEVVVPNTLESGGKAQSFKCLHTSLISTFCNDIYALELLNKLKHRQDRAAWAMGQVTIALSFNLREGKSLISLKM